MTSGGSASHPFPKAIWMATNARALPSMSPQFIDRLAQKLSPYRSKLGMPEQHRQVALEVLRENSLVADGTALFLVEKKFILHLSPTSFPDVAAAEVLAMQAAKARLGPKLGSVILDVTLSGELDGRSFMALPRCRPMSNNKLVRAWQRTAVRPVALRWLRGVVELAEPPSTPAADKFLAALDHLAWMDAIPCQIRSAAKVSMAKISAKEATPRFVPMHGDFWAGNILSSRHEPMIVIDWRGSLMEGFAIYDLIRFAVSLNLRPAVLRTELAYHASSLGASEQDTMIFLLAALGHFSANLGEFPVVSFRQMAIEAFSMLAAAVADQGGAL